MKTLYLRLLVLIALALPSAAVAQRGDQAYTEDRLNQLQQSISLLTGQIEQLQYRNQQLQQQLEKMQADYEFRLDQIEKGRPGGGPRPGGPPAAAPPAPANSPPQAAAPPPSGPANSAAGDQLYHDAFKMLQDGDYGGAEKAFKSFVQRNPQHVLAGNAQYWLGETYYARRDYQNAMTAFAEGYKVYKTSPKGPDNLLKLGITLAVLNRKSDACAVFARFNQDYPRATDLQKRRIDQERQKNGCG
jgi:tol-pal system protein YbgF